MEISAIKGGGRGGRRLMANAIKNFHLVLFEDFHSTSAEEYSKDTKLKKIAPSQVPSLEIWLRTNP